MFPRAALIPPCAATVWDRVGKSFVMQAVLRPASAHPIAARSPAPPAPTTTASYSWSTVPRFGFRWKKNEHQGWPGERAEPVRTEW